MTPELFAFIPTTGPIADISRDRRTIGLLVDLDERDLTGPHRIEISLPDAARLAAALTTELTTALTAQQHDRLARLRAELTTTAEETLR
ncbi:hypothetical protein NLU66_16695 [Brachybacterium sp. NBEC-018]|uniref:hypothetical protein n=1 Tax=Brachybacterium sp. NBEC-018 TaxID=2996004 RepID=UPI0021753AA1|nr:hypothetical protein [Brachybacterium sp. NBEC-018]UVY83827.1 hypothetical protein NLU66_16695 [Brachybacterium sp. NBEC-018]